MAKLTDEEAHDRLVAAREALGDEAGESAHADTALEAARRALVMFQLALVAAQERAEGRIMRSSDEPPQTPQ